VAVDAELQAWWDDVRLFGLGDRQRDPACWLELDTVVNLAKSLYVHARLDRLRAAHRHQLQLVRLHRVHAQPVVTLPPVRQFVPLPGSPEIGAAGGRPGHAGSS